MRETIQTIYNNFVVMDESDFKGIYGKDYYDRIKILIHYFKLKEKHETLTWHKIGVTTGINNHTVQKHYIGYQTIKGFIK